MVQKGVVRMSKVKGNDRIKVNTLIDLANEILYITSTIETVCALLELEGSPLQAKSALYTVRNALKTVRKNALSAIAEDYNKFKKAGINA